MARTKSVIMSKEETKAALAAAKAALKELKLAQKTISTEQDPGQGSRRRCQGLRQSHRCRREGIAAKEAEIEALSAK